jgi:hypothetical protein
MIRTLPVPTRRLVDPAQQVLPPDAARPHSDRRRGRGIGLDRILIALVAGGWGITVAWLVSGLGDPGARRAVADIGETGLDLLAAVIVLRAALRVDVRRIRLGWVVVGERNGSPTARMRRGRVC